MTCPCGGPSFATCCEPIIDGAPAPTAEALMRSRYTAFATRAEHHLVRSWHPRTRPSGAIIDPSTRWTGLTILAVEAGGVDDQTGIVEFEARYVYHGHESQIRERSTFVRRAGRWVYVDGIHQ